VTAVDSAAVTSHCADGLLHIRYGYLRPSTSIRFAVSGLFNDKTKTLPGLPDVGRENTLLMHLPTLEFHD
jgi:hypothetical protein